MGEFVVKVAKVIIISNLVTSRLKDNSNGEKKKNIKFGNCGNNRQYEGDDYTDDDNFDDDDTFDDDYFNDNDQNQDEDIVAQEANSGSTEDTPLSRINQLIQEFLKRCI